jgi:hypothetical protein
MWIAVVICLAGAALDLINHFKFRSLTRGRTNMKPTIGRIVHYQAYGTPKGEYPSVPRAAVVTELARTESGELAVSLCILNPTGMFFTRGVEYSETPKPGCWSWPPREETKTVITKLEDTQEFNDITVGQTVEILCGPHIGKLAVVKKIEANAGARTGWFTVEKRIADGSTQDMLFAGEEIKKI